jgi:hypothetical protein
MNENKINLAETLGTDLSNRRGAARLRSEIIRKICGPDDLLTIDFAGVRTLSDSFADELFGVLVENRREPWFRQHVRLVNLRADIRLTILEAIQQRLDRLEAERAGC